MSLARGVAHSSVTTEMRINLFCAKIMTSNNKSRSTKSEIENSTSYSKDVEFWNLQYKGGYLCLLETLRDYILFWLKC